MTDYYHCSGCNSYHTDCICGMTESEVKARNEETRKKNYYIDRSDHVTLLKDKIK